MAVPYTKVLSKASTTCDRMRVQVHFKGSNTIRNFLVAPKDRHNSTQKSAVIYRCKCDRLECDEEYIGESERTLEDGLREH